MPKSMCTRLTVNLLILPPPATRTSKGHVFPFKLISAFREVVCATSAIKRPASNPHHLWPDNCGGAFAAEAEHPVDKVAGSRKDEIRVERELATRPQVASGRWSR